MGCKAISPSAFPLEESSSWNSLGLCCPTLFNKQHILLCRCAPPIPILTDTPPCEQRLQTTMEDFSRGLDSTCSACVPTLQVRSHCSICFSQPWNSFYNSLVAFCLGELMPATTGEPQFIIFNCTHTVVSSSVRLHVSSPLINWNIRSWRNLHSCPKKKWKPPKNCSGLPFYSYISQISFSKSRQFFLCI